MRFILVGQTMQVVVDSVVIAEYTITEYLKLVKGGSIIQVTR